MAITAEPLVKKMQIKLNHGMVEGKEKFSSRTYTEIKSTATDQAIHQVATAIDSLQEPTMTDVIRIDSFLLLSA